MSGTLDDKKESIGSKIISNGGSNELATMY
jgi:hypothetical protein